LFGVSFLFLGRGRSPTESYPKICFFPAYKIEMEHTAVINLTVRFSSLKETIATTPLKIPRLTRKKARAIPMAKCLW
jgi:hypothetical protein